MHILQGMRQGNVVGPGLDRLLPGRDAAAATSWRPGKAPAPAPDPAPAACARRPFRAE